MAKSIYFDANVIATDSFSGWITKTNEVRFDMATVVVTVSSVAQPNYQRPTVHLAILIISRSSSTSYRSVFHRFASPYLCYTARYLLYSYSMRKRRSDPSPMAVWLREYDSTSACCISMIRPDRGKSSTGSR